MTLFWLKIKEAASADLCVDTFLHLDMFLRVLNLLVSFVTQRSIGYELNIFCSEIGNMEFPTPGCSF